MIKEKLMFEIMENFMEDFLYGVKKFTNGWVWENFTDEYLSKGTEWGIADFSEKPIIEISEHEVTVIVPEGIESQSRLERIGTGHSNGIFDFLGAYCYAQPGTTIGKIVLYSKAIEKVAISLLPVIRARGIVMTRPELIGKISKIVLWHELGHYITHWVKDSKGNQWNNSGYHSADVNIHEGLAQVFTCIGLLIDPDKESKLIFELLLIFQRSEYHRHLEIFSNRDFSWRSFFKAIEEIRLTPISLSSTFGDFLKYMQYNHCVNSIP